MLSLSFLPSVRHLIFDLGGVLYRLNFGAIERELGCLQEDKTTEVPTYTRQYQSELFLQYERGAISSTEFRAALCRELHLTAGDEDIDRAWCSMLVGLYEGRKAMLQELRRYYTLVLLSNTNEVHLQYVIAQYPDLPELFDACFFSHEIRMRKPDPETFRHVLETMNFLPEETLFIEDSPQHIEGALQMGIHTYWVHHPASVELVQRLLLQRYSPLQ